MTERFELLNDGACEEPTEDAEALFALGTRYSTGRDAAHDLVAAHKWFNLAAMMGHDEARHSRAEIAREMTAAQIADAQREAREWLWRRANKAKAQPAAESAPPATLRRSGEGCPQAGSPLRSLCA